MAPTIVGITTQVSHTATICPRTTVHGKVPRDVGVDVVLIDHDPTIMLHAPDPNKHLVEVPFVARSRTLPAGKAVAEFIAATPNGLIRLDNATFGQRSLHTLIADAEHILHPDGMLMILAETR
jgi:hypothetical protein